MTIILIVLLIGLYFVPSMVAADRKNHVGAIFALNLFLGWTMIGWVVALVLALWSNNKPEPVAFAVDITSPAPATSWWKRQIGQSERIHAARGGVVVAPAKKPDIARSER